MYNHGLVTGSDATQVFEKYCADVKLWDGKGILNPIGSISTDGKGEFWLMYSIIEINPDGSIK